jgi:hypothetical protein
MHRIKRLRPTPGALIGTIALVFALSGVAVAAKDKVQTNDIAKRAVTGSKIAPDAVKGGKIADGKIKAKHLAPGVIPDVPEQAYGRVNKDGANVAPATGAVGITGVAAGGAGVICYDLAFAPVSGTATVAEGGGPNRPGATAEVTVGAQDGCVAPYTDAATSTRALSGADPVVQPLDDAADRDVFVEFIGG